MTNERSATGPHRAWVVAADMGLGHLRAAFPLRDVAAGGVIAAGARNVTSDFEYALWNRIRRGYNILSRSRRIPLVGPLLSAALNGLEKIERLYPLRDLSSPSPQVRLVRRLVLRHGLGDALLEHIQSKPLPLLTTFYVPALAADYRDYPGGIYCVICDADINRVWAPSRPRHSRIHYCAPCETAVRRLQMYGVPADRITLTGFPLPKENLGPPDTLDVLKRDMARRLANLDPEGRCRKLHRTHMRELFGANVAAAPTQPLRIAFCIGGAGAQVEIAKALLHALRTLLHSREVIFTISAGTRRNVAQELETAIRDLGLEALRDRVLFVVHHTDRNRYFEAFNQAMRTTDVLWTKPSELSFYAGLGIPLIVAPPIGPHEEGNRRWLHVRHAGLDQEDPAAAAEWLYDLLHTGTLAEAAWQAFLHCPKMGAFNIERLLFGPPPRHTTPQ